MKRSIKLTALWSAIVMKRSIKHWVLRSAKMIKGNIVRVAPVQDNILLFILSETLRCLISRAYNQHFFQHGALYNIHFLNNFPF